MIERTIFLLLASIGVASCSFSPKLPSQASFDACRAQCSSLLDIEIPSCVLRKDVRESFVEYVVGIDDMVQSIELEPGACGCMTASLSAGGRFDQVDLIYSDSVDDPESLVSEFANLDFGGPVPEDASCLIGLSMPIVFFK